MKQLLEVKGNGQCCKMCRASRWQEGCDSKNSMVACEIRKISERQESCSDTHQRQCSVHVDAMTAIVKYQEAE